MEARRLLDLSSQRRTDPPVDATQHETNKTKVLIGVAVLAALLFMRSS